jgi:hypothetical protein
MQSKLLFRLVLLLLPATALTQSSYIMPGSKYGHFIDRMEIKARIEGLNQSFAKPLSRRLTVQEIQMIDSLHRNTNRMSIYLSKVDQHNIQKFLLNNAEWSNSTDKKLMAGGNLLEARDAKNYFSITPVLQYQHSIEKDNDDNPYIGSVGIAMRGKIGKVGFNFYGTGNKERLPLYMNNWLSRYSTVPGYGDFKVNDDGTVQYFDIRGSIQTTVAKFIDLQLGHDRNFLGNGHRSLLLSDFAGNMPFFKINVKVWKLNFQSLYAKLSPQEGIINQKNTKKFLRLNTLGINVTKWLNVGFFDAVVMGREKQFDLNYILPITFLRGMELQSGSPDNALLGFNAKANVSGKFQFYFQAVADEFKLSEIKAKTGWWANKYGYQIGAKYVDALGVRNLDVQVEANRVRPFTYTHFDSVSNYTHNNQPLAHPLGANFQEFIGLLHYQPLKKLYIQGKLVHYTQGLDSLGFNEGNNILTSYKNRPTSYGWKVGSGDKATCTYISGLASYELLENLFIDASIMVRRFKTELSGSNTTSMISLGLRWNVARREFDF